MCLYSMHNDNFTFNNFTFILENVLDSEPEEPARWLWHKLIEGTKIDLK